MIGAKLHQLQRHLHSFIQNFQDTSKLNDKEWLWLAHGVPHAHNTIAYQLPKERA